MTTLSLFPEDPGGDVQLLRSYFHAWRDFRASHTISDRANRELKEGSAKVYQEMWFAFADYCAARKLTLEKIKKDEIVAFLDLRARGGGNARMPPKGDTLSPRYAWRMLTLIDRITRYVAEQTRKQPNQAARELLEQSEYRYANARDKDPLPEYYIGPQAQQLIDFLTQPLGSTGGALPLHWKEVRDRAAVALMLGAGLTPGDVRAASASSVVVVGGKLPGLPWKLALPGNGNAQARETPIAEWAAGLLALWTKVRSENNVQGEVLFPSTLSGKPLSHATCYKVCKAVLSAAGMDDEAGGVFKLRHTFAIRQLADGKSEEDVARWLGLIDLNGMIRYRKIITEHVDLI